MQQPLLSLKTVRIQNFKSLRDITLSLDRINVLLGKNGSGKTNILEFFKFMKRILNFREFPYRPLVDWWSYDSLVYNNDENLPIKAHFTFQATTSSEKFPLTYEMIFGKYHGKYQIHYERFDLNNDFTIERDGDVVSLKTNHDLFNKYELQIMDTLLKLPSPEFAPPTIKLTPKKIHPIENKTPWSILSVSFAHLLSPKVSSFSSRRISVHDYYAFIITPGFFGSENIDNPLLDAFVIFIKKKHVPDPKEIIFPFEAYILGVSHYFQSISFIRHPNFSEIRKPRIVQGPDLLNENCDNLHSVLLQQFEKNMQLPQSTEFVLENYFDNMRIKFSRTEDGRSFISLVNETTTLKPPSISDGFYKLMSLLVAKESPASLLLIDEIENSLHHDALRFILSEFRETKNKQFLLSTHSPIVVDNVRLDELLLVSKSNNKTTVHRLSKRQTKTLQQFLEKEGLGRSDAWISGALNSEMSTSGLA